MFLAQDRDTQDKYKDLIKSGFFLGAFQTRLTLSMLFPGLCWVGFLWTVSQRGQG